MATMRGSDDFDGGATGSDDQVAESCRILIVDDDQDYAEEYVSAVADLGYDCIFACDPRTALNLIRADPQIGIVMTDIQMPGMTGLELLEEIEARFGALRPIVALVVTGFSSLPVAVNALRSNAVDFLSKPVSHEDLAAALRRATRRWAKQVSDRKLAMLAQLGTRIVDILTPGKLEMPPADPAESSPSDEQLADFARLLIRSRQQRGQFLDASLFADPAWDILLDLTLADLKGRTVPVSSACVAASVPLSTALRWVRTLTEAGLIKRWTDPQDRRRDLIALSDEARVAMLRYLAAIHASFGAR